MKWIMGYGAVGMVNEDLKSVKALMPKIDLDYDKMVKLPATEKPATAEEVLANLYQKVKSSNRLGYMYFIVRAVNDLLQLYRQAGEEPDFDTIQMSVSRIYDRLLRASSLDRASKLRVKGYNPDGEQFILSKYLSTAKDGESWVSDLDHALKQDKAYLAFKKWATNLPQKHIRDFLIKDDYYNMENMGADVNWNQLRFCNPEQVDRWVTKPWPTTPQRHLRENLKNNTTKITELYKEFQKPEKRESWKRFLEKLPTADTFGKFASLLLTVLSPGWGENVSPEDGMPVWSDLLRSTEGVHVIWSRGGKTLVRVDSSSAMNSIAWFTNWCILTQGNFKAYNDGKPWTQFALFDFNKEYDKNLDCLIGFTADPATGKIKWDQMFNAPVCQNRIDKPDKLPPSMYLEAAEDGPRVNPALLVAAPAGGPDLAAAIESGDEEAIAAAVRQSGQAQILDAIETAVASGDERTARILIKQAVPRGVLPDKERFKRMFLAAVKSGGAMRDLVLGLGFGLKQ